MFGFRRKQQVVVAVIEDTRPIAEVIEECKADMVLYDGIDTLIHAHRLQEYIGEDRENPISYISPKTRQGLKQQNFRVFVGKEFVMKFRYVAQLNVGKGGVVSENKELHYLTQVNYIGDIPEFALDRIDIAERLGLGSFTIHSMKPLKVARMSQLDPVLVAWQNSPSILVSNNGEVKECSDYCLGVILAVWDIEKEIEILFN